MGPQPCDVLCDREDPKAGQDVAFRSRSFRHEALVVCGRLPLDTAGGVCGGKGGLQAPSTGAGSGSPGCRSTWVGTPMKGPAADLVRGSGALRDVSAEFHMAGGSSGVEDTPWGWTPARPAPRSWVAFVSPSAPFTAAVGLLSVFFLKIPRQEVTLPPGRTDCSRLWPAFFPPRCLSLRRRGRGVRGLGNPLKQCWGHRQFSLSPSSFPAPSPWGSPWASPGTSSPSSSSSCHSWRRLPAPTVGLLQ